MARLVIAFDRDGDKDLQLIPNAPDGMRQAMLDLPEGLADRDIYEVARKLAELLLEQL